MVNCCREQLHMDEVAPNQTLQSEWDIVAEIRSTLQHYTDEDRPKYAWVKGHQDRKKAYNELSLRAQLNVDADALAEEYIKAHPDTEYAIAPVYPTTGIQLRLSKKEPSTASSRRNYVSPEPKALLSTIHARASPGITKLSTTSTGNPSELP